MAVYSPYVILNKTGLDIMVKSKSLLQSAKAAAGQVQSGEFRISIIFKDSNIQKRFRPQAESNSIYVFVP